MAGVVQQLITGDQCNFEDGTLGTYQGQGGYIYNWYINNGTGTLAIDGTQAHSGSNSAKATCTRAAPFSAAVVVNCTELPGAQVDTGIWVRNNTAGIKTYQNTIGFFTAGFGSIISINAGPAVAIMSGQWGYLPLSTSLPVNAAYFFMQAGPVAAPSIGDSFNIDDAFAQTTTTQTSVLYRSHTPYRDPALTYRGGNDPTPGFDVDVQSFVTMEIVTQAGAHVAFLNASSLQNCQWDLNDVGTCQVYLNKYDPGAQHILVNGGNELRVTFHNAINPATGLPEVWQGVPRRLQRQASSSNSLNLEGIFTYFKDRIIEFASMQYGSTDQIDIAWGLMEMAQTGANYDRNIHASYLPSGVIRSRNYSRDQHQVIYDLVRSFRSDRLQNGFDFTFTVDATGNKLFVPTYPFAGQQYPGFVEWGREVIDYNFNDDGTQQGTKVWAVGGGMGGVQFEMSYEDVASSQEFGAIVRTFSDGSELDPTWLLQVAQHQVAIRKIPIPNYSVLVAYDDASPLLGKLHVGDYLRVRIKDGFVQIDQSFRIQSIKWQVSPGPALLIQFYQPNLQGYIDPMAELTSLEV